MLRLIARLDVKNGVVVKTIQLEGQRRIGDPVELARRYYEAGVDELFFMDSVASLYDRGNLFDTIAEACRTVFIPITLGGGLRSLEDVETALRSGADKVAINTGLMRNPRLAEEVAITYGSQCLVGSIEAKCTASGWQAYISNGREPTGRDVIEWARELESRGVGELLVTSVDREGTQRGFDLDLYRALVDAVKVPVVASGGAGKVKDCVVLESAVEVQAMALASVLHYEKATVTQLKMNLPRAVNRARSSHAGHY